VVHTSSAVVSSPSWLTSSDARPVTETLLTTCRIALTMWTTFCDAVSVVEAKRTNCSIHTYICIQFFLSRKYFVYRPAKVYNLESVGFVNDATNCKLEYNEVISWVSWAATEIRRGRADGLVGWLADYVVRKGRRIQRNHPRLTIIINRLDGLQCIWKHTAI